MKKILALASALLITLPVHAAEDKGQYYSLEELSAKNIRRIQGAALKVEAQTPRERALQKIALKLGANTALANEYSRLEKGFEKLAVEMDRTYNFKELAVAELVLPPVISQSMSSLVKSSDSRLDIAGKSYVIEESAKVVSAYPTWRTYLKMNYKPPRIPKTQFMPKTKREMAVWDSALAEGAKLGAKQAAKEFESALGALNRDYQGMILYHTLKNNGSITPTIIKTTPIHNVVTQDGRMMTLDNIKVEIANQSVFKENLMRQGKQPATYLDKRGRTF